ncbi:hypothetical protein A2Z33_02925 [Candidatus Gottesmanbacteria bacterium RBG_16_52_11]|uniref:Glycosyltransferase RgtA/B/C/D-like domain-containing protein n=1 Tax=Candidatus Gottesmanbacteria bacterium RBG_16_52_11 TaxID=1798374 RepID=A0A1F5YMD0_9BACT|nr:MAG: hypothetical protein A2Z33_02925 [Candidatus Gottesmanbacteria bacterium RBG_16_52_11]
MNARAVQTSPSHNRGRTLVVLCLITGLAALLRLAYLSDFPPSLSHDEVAIGYNAYSVLKTGRDEYGTPVPLMFRSFDDYKLPGMVYATVPTVALLGLNPWGVRLPSAVFGILAVMVFAGLTAEVLRGTQFERLKVYGVPIWTWGTMFFAVSVWHINFSRQSFESNGAVFFLMLGIYALLLSRRQLEFLFTAAVSFAAAIYFYYSVRLVIPPVLLAYVIIYRRDLAKSVRTVIAAAILGLLLLSPLLPRIFSAEGFSRISMVSVVNDDSYIGRLRKYSEIAAAKPDLLNRVRYNRRVALAFTIAENYAKNLSPKHVFLTGTGSGGLMYLYELPLLLLGIATLLRLTSPVKWIIAVWAFSAFLPGALSQNQPNALRTLAASPVLSVFSALGFIVLTAYPGNTHRIVRRIMLIGFTGLVVSAAITFFGGYLNYMTLGSLAFGDGYRQMVGFASVHSAEYENIIITGRYWRPYIFTLFWTGYDPASYQNTGSVDGFGKFRFVKSGWDAHSDPLADSRIPVNSLAPPGINLYILSPGEYSAHKSELTLIRSIHGVYAPEVFIAAAEKVPVRQIPKSVQSDLPR